MKNTTGLLIFIALIFLNGCTHLGVKPWERDRLSKPEMQFGVNSNEDGFDDHTYFSKEGSSGGRSFSAGGCGCN
ncbi:MAG: DUF4266 domain-containing protein [Bdellovibrionaceae bacterium]|nr:DUF4266 domain-containing protein [Pseudobdellovibrionaceae bacterium]